MAIICSGSLAYDRFSSFGGEFKDHILTDKIDYINLCFLVDQVETAPGGTAGNIVYNLHLLGESPLVISAVGQDPEGQVYLSRLKEFGLDTTYVALATKPTAGAYICTDAASNQLTFFNSGAMSQETSFEPASLPQPYDQHLAIVAPGGLADMKNLCRLYRDLGVRFIFDPGQQVPAFTGPELLDMLDGSLMLITNEYELDLFLERTKLKVEELFQYTTTIVTTLGGEGSRLTTPKGSQHIMPGPIEELVNPTGAGDAYRAGILKALAHNEAIITACRLGSTVASFCVEAAGPQSHYFRPGEVLARHFRTFKETINCLA
ncbi:MAG: carbohydrate kinase family protein [Deltaproteobacteria bacterium]|jgi:adenosine kinase|nr:carbohydrate kinase family protein [Deltaproteobacteria bacterium]